MTIYTWYLARIGRNGVRFRGDFSTPLQKIFNNSFIPPHFPLQIPPTYLREAPEPLVHLTALYYDHGHGHGLSHDL